MHPLIWLNSMAIRCLVRSYSVEFSASRLRRPQREPRTSQQKRATTASTARSGSGSIGPRDGKLLRQRLSFQAATQPKPGWRPTIQRRSIPTSGSSVVPFGRSPQSWCSQLQAASQNRCKRCAILAQELPRHWNHGFKWGRANQSNQMPVNERLPRPGIRKSLYTGPAKNQGGIPPLPEGPVRARRGGAKRGAKGKPLRICSTDRWGALHLRACAAAAKPQQRGRLRKRRRRWRQQLQP